MTPKEKAKELIAKFISISYEFVDEIVFSFAIESAMLLVTEIEETEALSTRSCGYLTLGKRHQEYWEQVRLEIEVFKIAFN